MRRPQGKWRKWGRCGVWKIERSNIKMRAKERRETKHMRRWGFSKTAGVESLKAIGLPSPSLCGAHCYYNPNPISSDAPPLRTLSSFSHFTIHLTIYLYNFHGKNSKVYISNILSTYDIRFERNEMEESS